MFTASNGMSVCFAAIDKDGVTIEGVVSGGNFWGATQSQIDALIEWGESGCPDAR